MGGGVGPLQNTSSTALTGKAPFGTCAAASPRTARQPLCRLYRCALALSIQHSLHWVLGALQAADRAILPLHFVDQERRDIERSQHSPEA